MIQNQVNSERRQKNKNPEKKKQGHKTHSLVKVNCLTQFTTTATTTTASKKQQIHSTNPLYPSHLHGIEAKATKADKAAKAAKATNAAKAAKAASAAVAPHGAQTTLLVFEPKMRSALDGRKRQRFYCSPKTNQFVACHFLTLSISQSFLWLF